MSSPSSGIPEPSVRATDRKEAARKWSEEIRAALSERPLGLGGGGPVPGGRRATVRLTVNASLHTAIGRTAREHGVTPLTVGLAALAVTVTRYTARLRLVVGSASNGEAGMPVLLTVRDDQSGAGLLSATHGSLEHSLSHHTAPADRPGDAPAVLLEFSHDTDATAPASSSGNVVRIAFRASAGDDAAELVATFPAGHYTRTQLRRFLGHLRTALAALTRTPEAPVGGLSLLDDAQTGELLALGLGSALPSEDQVPVHTLVAEAAAKDPGRLAVACGEEQVSRGGLDAWAARITSRLIAAGVGRGDRVGILAERSAAAVAAVLGTVRAGAAYVPIDPAGPDERIASIFANARVAAVVVTGRVDQRLAGLSLPIVQADEPAVRTGGTDGAAGTGTDAARPTVTAGPEDAAYLVYTSGSTGTPKGVLVEHGQLAASTLARRQVYPGEPVFLLLSPLAFDSSAAGLWGTLTAGGRLIIAGQDEFRDPERLVRLVERHEVTHLLCVPSLYAMILAAGERDGLHRLRSLTTVIVAGEVLPEALLLRHTAALGDTALVNEYGPTETTIWASYRRCAASGPVDIGGPVPGARLYVLDDARRLVPPGVIGELCIGGAGVSRGYFGRPDATRRAFLQDPFAGDGARMYLTGDLVRWTEAGTLEFLGRRDSQVKIRGHRVELGAVEAALRACPGIREAVVVLDTERTRLIGFVLADHDMDSLPTRERLARRLPEVAIPAQLQVMDTFPVTANGKVDRAALAERAKAQDQMARRSERNSPASGTSVAQVAAAWAEVLQISEVPTSVNFFEVGGHSLMIFRLQEALEGHTGVRPSPLDLYRCTTVETQAELVRAGSTGPPGAAPAGDGADRARRARAARARRARSRRQGGGPAHTTGSVEPD